MFKFKDYMSVFGSAITNTNYSQKRVEFKLFMFAYIHLNVS